MLNQPEFREYIPHRDRDCEVQENCKARKEDEGNDRRVPSAIPSDDLPHCRQHDRNSQNDINRVEPDPKPKIGVHFPE